MANYVEEFVAFLGWEVDSTELEGFNQQVEELGGMLKTATAIVVGAAGALTAMTAVVNETTAANIALARSVGVSSEFLESMGAAVRPLGFEMENVVDLVEEMNNKMGESIGLGQPISAVADATKILGLEFKALRDLAPEDQFVAILDAAKNLENQQAAVSAVDILMGGEANKILGFLRDQDESLLDLIERQMQLNLLTEKGRQGAERFNDVFGEMRTVINSAKSEFFGLIGDALSPLLETYRDWVVVNNELIKSKIAEWADRLGRAINWVFSVLTWFIGKVGDVIDILGGFDRVLQLTAVALTSVFGAKMVLAIGTFIKMMRAAGTEALLMNIKAALIPATIAAIIALFALIGEDLYVFFTGGDSALGKLGDKIAEFAHENVRPGIANFLGMTPEELDLELVHAVDSMGDFWDSVIDYTSIGIEKIVEFFTWLFNEIMKTGDMLTSLGAWIGDSLGKIHVAIAEFFQSLSFWLQDALTAFSGWLGTISGYLAGFAERMRSMGVSILEFFSNVGTNIVGFFRGLVDSFVSFVSSIPERLIAFVRQSVSGISEIVRGLPVVGGLFGDDQGAPARTTATGSQTGRPLAVNQGGVSRAAVEALSTVQAPTASPASRATAANIDNSRRSVNRTTQVSNEFNITQNPGESSRDLAERVVEEIQRASARAVSANDSGIEV